MATPEEPRPQPAGKSKTDLRRGQFTPGMARPKKEVVSRGGEGTSLDEQAMLFEEERGEGT